MKQLDNSMLSIDIKKIDLNDSYREALKNPDFKDMVDNLNLSKDVLKNYTSLLEECSIEYGNCKHCKGIPYCKNKVCGYAYLPINIDGRIEFGYVSCHYLNKANEENKFTSNVTLVGASSYLKDARMKNIYTDDKNRFECIKWLKDFIKNYPSSKGLYLCGNFGCGKSYLVAAMFNELAKKNVKSMIVFWSSFLGELKGSFGNDSDFNYKMNRIKNIPLLLIDDIGAENLTDWARDEILCPILNARMENKLPTFFTSNLDLEMLEQHLSVSKSGVDRVKAKRIVERIKQQADMLKMVGENYRK